MLFGLNGTEWTTIISTASGVAVLGASVWRYFENKFPNVAKDVPSGVKHVLDEGATLVKDLGQTPWFASQAAAGKVELRHVTDKLLTSHLATAAGDALASFEKSIADMSEGEKGTAIEMVQSALKAVGQDITAAQALSALKLRQVAIDTKKPVAQAATERSKALQPPATDTPDALATDPQPAPATA